MNQATEPGGKESAGTSPNGRLRRIAALAAVILLAGLYVFTFVLAILGDARSAGLLRFSFGMTIFLPIFLWVVIWCVGYLRHKKSMASLNILDSNPLEREKMEKAVARETGPGGPGSAGSPGDGTGE